MSKYDLPEESVKKDPPPICEHKFDDVKKTITEYADHLCLLLIKHGQSGFFIEGFSGRHGVSLIAICEWLSNSTKYPDFNSALRVAHSACIHYYNEELIHAIKLGDWQAVAQIKSILEGIMKTTPKELREGLLSNLKQKTYEEIEDEQKRADREKFKDELRGGKSGE